MSTALATSEERPRITEEEAAPILTTAPNEADNRAFPAWFSELRRQAWKDFQQLPAPTRTVEAWRFATIKSLSLDGYIKAAPVSEQVAEELIARSPDGKRSARLIYANDQLIARQVCATSAIEAKGVIWKPLDRALVENEELVRRHFMSQDVVLGSKKFAALHAANVRAGAFIYVPKNTEVALPIETVHWLHGQNSSVFPHTLIIVGENSKVTVIDRFESADSNARGFVCGVNDLFLEQGAKLTYVNVQDWSRETFAVQINSTVVGRDAAAINMALNLGGKYARTESVSRLVGEGSRSDMLAVTIADGAQEFDQRTLQDHRAPHATSDLLYKNSLDDEARTIFAGLIRAEPGSNRTDGYQKNRNLILSENAEAIAMPGLEIMQDDLRCTHGATVGQVDAEELFYMLSRGIPQDAAHRLIVFGFLNEVIERLGDEKLGDDLRELMQRKFA
jgi:Fe-S cluster assembly protein SufD